MNNKQRYEELIINANELEGLLQEFKNTIFSRENIEWTKAYFVENLSKLIPNFITIKKINALNIEQTITNFERFIKHLKEICKIYVQIHDLLFKY